MLTLAVVRRSFIAKLQNTSARRSISIGSVNRNSEQKGDTYMKKFDVKKDFDKLSSAEQMYVKRLQNLNATRMKNLKQRQNIARNIGLGLSAFVLAVYFYTMFAVKQETFLNDFDLPDPVEIANDKQKRV